MKNFACSNCGQRVYFENVTCLNCGHALGFDADALAMMALAFDAREMGLYRRVNGGAEGVRYCANAQLGVCNWLAPDGGGALCKACNLNRTIPNLAEAGSREAWRDLERAKKRLVYSLLRFGLPFDGTNSLSGPLTFDFVRWARTGHLGGVITIDIMEADAVERERQRQQFGEPYRSLLGHLRHEAGHYYWHMLVERPFASDRSRLDEFRALFGDERPDYDAAIAHHYGFGPPLDWSQRHVSAYASAHPWEDWAETWAHYLHMVNTLDTAEASGMEPRTAGLSFGSIWPFKVYDIYREETFDALMERWIPLTLALNGLSRSMGHDDFYPFVIPGPAKDKLAFVHRAIRERG
jgi:hypothetical protein